MDQLWPDPITRLVEHATEKLEREATELRAKKADIDSRLAEIDGELGELQIAVKVYRRFAPERVPTPFESPPVASSSVAMPPRLVGSNGHRPELDGLTVADAAVQVLRWLGGSAESGEIRQHLVDGGVIADNHNAYSYLLKTLKKKNDQFVKVERGTWALREDD